MPRRRRRAHFELNADVNVVSLIDVMLLLLVIFMITAPMMQGGVDLRLPEADAHPMEAKDGLNIELHADGTLLVDGEKLKMSEFKVAAKSLTSRNRSKAGVYLSADGRVPYEMVAQVLAILTNAGVNNVGLATQQPRQPQENP